MEKSSPSSALLPLLTKEMALFFTHGIVDPPDVADGSIDIGIALLLLATFLTCPGSDRLSAYMT
jgi:hypothetical protein